MGRLIKGATAHLQGVRIMMMSHTLPLCRLLRLCGAAPMCGHSAYVRLASIRAMAMACQAGG